MTREAATGLTPVSTAHDLVMGDKWAFTCSLNTSCCASWRCTAPGCNLAAGRSSAPCRVSVYSFLTGRPLRETPNAFGAAGCPLRIGFHAGWAAA